LVDLAEKEQEKAFAVNSQGPHHLAQLRGIKVVHVSTDYVFDGEKNASYLETDACAPKNIYGLSKRAGEERLLALAPESCVVRTSWLFGKGGNNFISKLPYLLLEKERVQVDASCVSTPTYCLDLAEALLDFLPKSGLFHYAGEEAVSRLAVAELMLKMGLPFKCRTIEPLDSPVFQAARPRYSALKSLYPIKKQRPLKEALKEFVHEL
jgi:dTDP-4-dehydrorhamnose reductase